MKTSEDKGGVGNTAADATDSNRGVDGEQLK